MGEVVSLFEAMNEKWQQIRLEALADLYEADYNLFRIAIIYSGQLSLDNLIDDIANKDRDPYGPLGDPRSVTHGDDW